MDRNTHVCGTSSKPNPRQLTVYEATIRGLSDRLVEIARPIRILDAVKWDDGVEDAFFAAECRVLPNVTRDYYAGRSLAFDADRKRAEFRELEGDIRRWLGPDNAAGRLMARRCQEGRVVVDLIAQRGTPAFSALSRRLYGSASDCCHAGGPPLAHLGRLMTAILASRPQDSLPGAEVELSAAEAVCQLSTRLAEFFKGATPVSVRLSDGIVADATAGTDYIKLRGDARFTPRELRLLEVHEGWVHFGTTLNGQAQPICTFLTRGTPSATVTQEGLAVLTEVLALASHPARVQRLAHRVEAVALAEAGADFLEVYRFYLGQGYEPREGYQHTTRVFRGSLPANCGPFTKDLSYGKGFVLVSEFVRAALGLGQTRLVQLLFCGKTSLEDTPYLAQLADEGILQRPRHLPPPFTEPDALAALQCLGNLVKRLFQELDVSDQARQVSSHKDSTAHQSSSRVPRAIPCLPVSA